MVGLIAFANDGGLGIQTKRLYQMLKPDKVMVVDARGFSRNKQFHADWYPNATVTNGFPKNHEIAEWIKGLKTVFTVENPYNFYLIHACRQRGIKTICQTNYEFCENLIAPWLPVPDLFLMPSYWKFEEMKDRFGHNRVVYLPPPIDPEDFNEVYEENRARAFDSSSNKIRFLHIVGTLAHADRNGTLDLLNSVRETKEDFELVIHSQHELPAHYLLDHPKITYRVENFENIPDLYAGFDALILPRRYGGLSLTTNEALMAGLPVMMTNVSPNNQLLPQEWLIPAKPKEEIQVRATITCFESDIQAMAYKLDEWSKSLPNSFQARKIALDNFNVQTLVKSYKNLL